MAQPKTSQAEFDAKLAVARDIDWARLAAYVDGEGSILIARTAVKTGTKRPQYTLELVVANTNPLLIQWLCDTFGGIPYFSPPLGGSCKSRMYGVKATKRCMSWKHFEGRAASLIEKILPYLIIKQEQAKVALAYREVRKMGSKGRKLTDEDIVVRDGLRNQMRALNSGDWVRQEN